MKTIGVVGAGVMGSGVAQCFAQFGHNVILVDISDRALKRAKDEINKIIKFSVLFNKKATESSDAIMGRIVFTKDYDMLGQADYLVESVTEDMEIKKGVYQKLDEICDDNCILAANTSCIPITRIASFTKRKRQSKVVGTHFMNPVHMKSVIEVIKGHHTSDATIGETQSILGSIGKECVVVNDYPGFVSNRLSHLLMNEAAFLVQDQVASPKDVDYIFKKCYEHKMGPLETADLIGLDTVVNSLNVLYEHYQDSKFRCCPLLRKMADAGLHGVKSGEGFYKY